MFYILFKFTIECFNLKIGYIPIKIKNTVIQETANLSFNCFYSFSAADSNDRESLKFASSYTNFIVSSGNNGQVCIFLEFYRNSYEDFN